MFRASLLQVYMSGRAARSDVIHTHVVFVYTLLSYYPVVG